MATDEAAREAALDARRAQRHAEFLGFDAEAYRLGWHDGADNERARAEALAAAVESFLDATVLQTVVEDEEELEAALVAYRSGREQS